MFRLSRGFRSLLIVPALMAAAVLPACGGGSGGGDTETIRIAVCGPMTGSAAAFGEMIKNAAKLKEKEINDAGGLSVRGKMMMVEAVIYDDKGDTTEATNVARRVASDDSITLVIGHFNSTCSLAAKEEYNEVGIVEFSPGSTNVAVCKNGPYTFRNLYSDDYQGQQIATYFAEIIGVKTVAVIFDNDDYGKGLMQSFSAKAKELGIDVVATVSYLRERTQDFKPLVQQAKDAGAEGIFMAGLYNEAALIVKAARQDLQLTIPLFGGDGVMSPTFIKNAGTSAEGVYVATPFLVHEESGGELVRAFVDAYSATYGKDPDTWAALTYDAMGMALDAVSKVGTDRSAVRDQLASAVDAASGYTGVTGITFFDEEGDCFSKPLFVTTVNDGVFTPAQQLSK